MSTIEEYVARVWMVCDRIHAPVIKKKDDIAKIIQEILDDEAKKCTLFLMAVFGHFEERP